MCNLKTNDDNLSVSAQQKTNSHKVGILSLSVVFQWYWDYICMKIAAFGDGKHPFPILEVDLTTVRPFELTKSNKTGTSKVGAISKAQKAQSF